MLDITSSLDADGCGIAYAQWHGISKKMNVLHLHLTEYQMFEIESKVYPRLHEVDA